MERQFRITTGRMILAPLANSDVHKKKKMELGVCYLPSAVVEFSVIINDSVPALFVNRPPLHL